MNGVEGFPCAIISNASRPNQKVAYTTLKGLEEAAKEMIRPSILVFGKVIGMFKESQESLKS